MEKLIKRIFSWKNALNIATMGIALLAIFNIFPMDRLDIILVLLTIIAFDTMIERLITLTDIEEKVNDLIASRSAGFLQTRGELNKNEDYGEFLKHTKKEILIVGINCAELFNSVHPDFWVNLIKRGVKIRFLIHKPDSQFIPIIAKYFGYDEKHVVGGFAQSLDNFNTIKRKVYSLNTKPKGSLKVKYVDDELTFGVTMRDSEDLETGAIRFEILLFKTNSDKRPAFKLIPADRGDFDKFKNSLNDLWDSATEIQ